MNGVLRTRVGYAGGRKENPTYHSIGNHIETIQIDYDQEKITYEDLLSVFLSDHNPTWKSPIRQYVSAVFYHDDDQKHLAVAALEDWALTTGKKPATDIVKFTRFTLAEDYHQKYRLKSTRQILSEYERVYPDPRNLTNSTAVARVNGYLGGNGSLSQLTRELPGLGLSESAGKLLTEYVERYN